MSEPSKIHAERVRVLQALGDSWSHYQKAQPSEAFARLHDALRFLVLAGPVALAGNVPGESLNFQQLRAANQARHRDGYDREGWTATDWACALAGECGEACNLIKKARRGDKVDKAEIGAELADLVTYADLLADHLGIDLGEAVRKKFNAVSLRVGSAARL